MIGFRGNHPDTLFCIRLFAGEVIDLETISKYVERIIFSKGSEKELSHSAWTPAGTSQLGAVTG